jgi:hypothetical protein
VSDEKVVTLPNPATVADLIRALGQMDPDGCPWGEASGGVAPISTVSQVVIGHGAGRRVVVTLE